MDLQTLNLDQLILVKDHPRRHYEDEEFGKRGPLDENDEYRVASSSDREDNHDSLALDSDRGGEKPEEKEDSTPVPREETGTTESPSSVGECVDSTQRSPVEENDDGFRTPPAPENKIPATKRCPPAPRKPKPCAKRKSPTERSAACRSLIFEFSEREFEAMFPPANADSNPDRYVLKLKKRPRKDSEGKD